MDQTTMDDASGAMVPMAGARLCVDHEPPDEMFITSDGRPVNIAAMPTGHLHVTVGKSQPLVFTPAQTAALSQFFRGL